MDELTTLYNAFSADHLAARAPNIQYADFAVWQRQRLQAELLEAQLNYWKESLGDSLHVLELPTDKPRLPARTFNGTTHSSTYQKDFPTLSKHWVTITKRHYS